MSDLRSHVLTFEAHVLGKDEIATLKKRLGALESAFHAFDLYTNVAGPTTPLGRGSKEWLTLEIVIRIRNRITHPTSVLNFQISDLDLRYLRTAETEIVDLLIRCLRDSSKARLKQVRALERRWKEAHGAGS